MRCSESTNDVFKNPSPRTLNPNAQSSHKPTSQTSAVSGLEVAEGCCPSLASGDEQILELADRLFEVESMQVQAGNKLQAEVRSRCSGIQRLVSAMAVPPPPVKASQCAVWSANAFRACCFRGMQNRQNLALALCFSPTPSSQSKRGYGL